MNRTFKPALAGLASLFAVSAASAESIGPYTALVTSSNVNESGATSQVITGVADVENCKKIAEGTKSTTYTSVVCLNKRGEVEGSFTCKASSLYAPSTCSAN